MKYLSWNETTINDFSEKNISEMYEKGYVFTRLGKGVMQQTRSIRVDLSKFELSSENRRILKKVSNLKMDVVNLPLDLGEYDFSIGKIAKDFYENKFGPGIMSAQKIKMMLTDSINSNFNRFLKFNLSTINIDNSDAVMGKSENLVDSNNLNALTRGFTICFATPSILHYSYPFYDLKVAPKDMGLGMMTKAIEDAKETGLKYVYLGSLQRPNDTYKFQFSGIEWFDGEKWSVDLEEAKKVLGQ